MGGQVLVGYGAIPTLPKDLTMQESSIRSFDEDARSFLSTDTRSLIDVQATEESIGTASVPSEVVSITKNLVGAGVLSLSGGVALYSNDPTAIVSGSIWVVLLGAMFGYFCLIIAKVCHKTGSSTYRECWEATMGNRGAFGVTLVSALLPAQGDLSYATVLSQTMKSLMQTFHIYWSRVSCLMFITFFMLLPLCLMKDLDALAPFSALGVASVGVALIAMMIRCFDGSYQPGGIYYDDLTLEFQPIFGYDEGGFFQWSMKVLPFVCMVFQSWVMHYNVPRFYMELKDASIPRFARAIGCSFGFSAAIYIAIAAAGFWTFGGHSSSYILNNYSPNDPLATVSRIGVFFSTLLIYPLAFIGCRDACMDIFQVPAHLQTTGNLNIFSMLLLAILTVLAIFFDDLGLINAIGGGAFATFLCFVFPALMFRQAVRQQNTSPQKSEEREVILSMTLMSVGVVLGMVGVWQSISEALR